jgi:choice-of-anchor A domain-containing protein
MKLTLPSKLFFILFIFCCGSNIFAQSPTDSAYGFNIFLNGNATLVTNETEGPVAIGGNLTVAGNYQVNIHNNGSFKVSNTPIGLFVGGKVIFQSGSLQVNNSRYVKIGDCAGSNLKVWYRDNNNAASNIYITPSANSYSSTPNININANALTWGSPEVSSTNNPVCDANVPSLMNFTSVFANFQSKSASMAACSATGIDLTNPNGNVHGTTITSVLTSGQLKINLSTGVNVLNCTGSELNNVTGNITFNTQPDASHILVINVNAAGSFTWNVWNQAGIGGTNAPYILYNFYNTTSLSIAGNSTIEGTVFAPYADITKTINQSNIEGQIIAQSFYQSGGEVHYYPFAGAVSGCSTPCSNPVVSDITGTNSVCTGSTTQLSDITTGGTWKSSDTTIAKVSSTGLISGIAAGSTTVSYSVTNSCGTTVKTVSVTVIANAVPLIQGNASFCKGGNSVLTSGSASSYQWYLNGTAISGATLQSYTATVAGTYSVIVTNSNGCSATSASYIVTQINKPLTGINVNPATQYLSGNNFVFNPLENSSSDTYTWSFGDGSTSAFAVPSKTYSAIGNYTVKLKITNSICADSTSVIVNVKANQPTFNPTIPTCSNGSVNAITQTASFAKSNTDWDLVYNPQVKKLPKFNPSLGTLVGIAVKAKGTATTNFKIEVTGNIPNGTTRDAGGNDTVTFSISGPNGIAVAISSAYFTNWFKAATYDGTLDYGGTSGYSSPVQAITDSTAQFFTDIATLAAFTGSDSVSFNALAAARTYTVLPTGNGSAFYQTYMQGDVQVTYYYCSPCVTPVAGIISGKDTVCTGSQIAYTVSGNSVKGLWSSSNTSIFTIDTTGRITAVSDGIASVVYTVTNNCGTVTALKTIVIKSPVNLTSISGKDTLYKEQTFVYTNSQSGGSWSSSNSSVAAVNPVSGLVTAAAAGDAIITYTYNNPGGCSSIVNKKVVVIDTASSTPNTGSLIAAFNLNTMQQCLTGNQFVITNNSTTGSNISYSWDFGDGTTSALKNPVKTYTVAGNYRIHLEVRNGNNYVFVEKFIDVKPMPAANFNILAGTGNGHQVTYISSSTIQSGSMNYLWNFGNGSVSTLINPLVSYSNTGNYHVLLIVTSDFGCVDSISKNVTVDSSVYVDNTPCNLKADFDLNELNQCVLTNRYVFTDKTTGGSGTLIYKWDFNDGTYSSDHSPTHVYSTYSDHDLSLSVWDSKGCYSGKMVQITVGSVPKASFDVFYNTADGKGTTFVSTSSIPSGNLTYNWDLGNGTTSNAVNPTVNYNAGTYSVKLIAQGIGTCKDSVTKIITIASNPASGFTYNRAGCSTGAEEISFTASASGGTAPYTYLWNFGDNSTSSLAAPVHSFSEAGTYNVTLKITDALGVSSTKTETIECLAKSKPVVNFKIEKGTNNGYSYTFISTATIGSGWMNYSWDLGDGSASALVNPTVTYNALGYYNVRLLITGNTGCKDSASQVINVTNIADTSATVTVTVSPNPAINNAVLTFKPTGIVNKVMVRVLNSSGNLVSQQLCLPNQVGAFVNCTLNVTTLQSGFYFVILSDENDHRIGSASILKN